MRLEGNPVTIIGVAPESLVVLGPGSDDVDVWRPLPSDDSQVNIQILARLRDGVTLDRANERMKALDLAAADSKADEWSTRLTLVSDGGRSRACSRGSPESPRS